MAKGPHGFHTCLACGELKPNDDYGRFQGGSIKRKCMECESAGMPYLDSSKLRLSVKNSTMEAHLEKLQKMKDENEILAHIRDIIKGDD